MSETMRILACQITVPETRTVAERDAHLQSLSEKISLEVSTQPVDLVVLPELSSIEYSDGAFACLSELEEPLCGPSFEVFSTLAKMLQTPIVYGFPCQTGAGRHICQAVVGASGRLIGHFNKLHIAQHGASAEAAHFQPGDHIFVFTLNGLRIAPIICYDIRFPNLSQRLIDEQVDIVLQCSAYGPDPYKYSWRHFAVARAMEGQFCWIGLNRAGLGWGGSVFSRPVVHGKDREQILGEEEKFWRIDIPVDHKARTRAVTPYHRDRRGDIASMGVIAAVLGPR